jgi:hypothetical protein
MTRSRANKVADGIKATQTKIAMFGPTEPSRAAAQRGWTIANPNSPRSENPHIREKVYSSAVLAQAKRFEAWRKFNPGKPDSENPHAWNETSD